MTLVILEGLDCAGKTTLAGRIIDRLRAEEPGAAVGYRHAGVPQEHPLDEYVEPLLGYHPGTNQHMICDRWHLGESVYPALLGRFTDLTEGVRAYVELFLRARGALLVYCEASYDYLRDCGVSRGDAQEELARIYDTQQLFRRRLAESNVPLMTVGATADENVELAVSQVLSVARQLERAALPVAPFTTYVGDPRPALLLVGDRRGTPVHDLDEFDDWPAFAPYASTSGSYLLTTLTMTELRVPEHGVQLRDVALVNANDVDDVRDVWDATGRPSVVGLGVRAGVALRKANVPYRSVPHPQYQRRFRHDDRAGYLDQLLGATKPQVVA